MAVETGHPGRAPTALQQVLFEWISDLQTALERRHSAR